MEEQTFKEEGEIEGADADDASFNDESDTSDEDVKSVSSDFLVKAKEITGREFKDEDDFKKHYKNLSSFVGKKSEKKSDDSRVEELEFKVDHPEFKEHFDVIKMVAKEKGLSYSEAVSDPMVKEIVEVRQNKRGESIIHSNNKISQSSDKKYDIHTEDGLAGYLEGKITEQ